MGFTIGIPRSNTNRWFLGVCGGLAHYLDISPKLVRNFTLVAAVIIPGVSIWMVLIAYFALAFLMPNPDSATRF